MASRYWVPLLGSGTGDWSNTGHWSTTSGGAGGASIPTSADNVFFDANSFTANNQTVGVDNFYSLNNLSFTGVSYGIMVSGANTLNVNGDVTLVSQVWLSANLRISSLACDFTQNGALITSTVTVGQDALLNLQGAFSAGALNFGASTSIKYGSLDSNNHPITVDSMQFYFADTVDFGSSIVTVNGSGFNILDSSVTFFQASSATFKFTGTGTFNLDFSSVGKLEVSGMTTVRSSHTFSTLELKPGSTLISYVSGGSATTQTVSTFIAVGTSGASITVKSSSVGLQHVLRKTSGVVDAYYVKAQDSVASGGATWNNYGGTNLGNNSGWNFLAGPIPTWSFIASASSVHAPSLVPGRATMAPNFIASVATAYAINSTMFVSNLGNILSSPVVYSPAFTSTPPPPAPPTDWEAIGKEDEKVYVYKVYSSTGAFIGIWTDVKDDLEFTQRLNTPGTTTTVLLNRSPNTTKEVRANLTTEAGEPIVTEDLERLTVTYETNNSVGEDTDVDINYNVDVYVHYGEFANLITESDETLITESGDQLIVSSGAPSGIRVFSGYILDYESLYGEETGVTVTLASHGTELSNELVRNGETIQVTYSSSPIETTLKSILDTNPQTMTYDTASIQSTGLSVTSKFQLNTKLEAIESLYDLTPDGWFWYGNVADNNVYLQPTAATPHHTFMKGYHIKEVALRRSMEQMRNRVYVVGAEVSGTSILKKYEDTTSQTNWRVGLHRITDRRYSVTDSIQRLANKQMFRYKNPIYTTNVVINSARYDLESIKLGQVVSFSNFGNFVDDLLLQIVGLSYTPTAVSLDLGEVLQSQHERIEELNDGLQGEQYLKLPTAPS